MNPAKVDRRRRWSPCVAGTALVAAVALALLACSRDPLADAGHLGDAVYLAEGESWYVAATDGPELHWSRSALGRTNAGTMQPAGEPTLDDVWHLRVPGAGREIALVFGRAPVDTAEMRATTDLGMEVDVALTDVAGTRWFLAEVLDPEARVDLDALDAEGGVLDRGSVSLPDDDLGGR